MGMKHAKLRGRIREKFGAQEAFAAAMGLHRVTLSCKLNGKRDWTRQEIETAVRLLDISVEDIAAYFFN